MNIIEKNTELVELIATHKAMMAAHDALYEADDDDASDMQDALYLKLLASRKAILACRPATLEDVAIKARLMASDRAFNFWDIDGTDVEGLIPAVIASLIPAGMDEGEVVANAA